MRRGRGVHVLATAGHVDHGKSSLVRALTGQEPDRHAEERRRGLTIDLGFVWTEIDGQEVAFVDVPGHQRFITTMLAGVGPVPAVMLVVAADSGWSAQTEEHVAVLDALGVRHGLVVVTRSDLADPEPVRAEVSDWLADTTLAGLPIVAASSVTGAGLDDVRTALAGVLAGLPRPDLAVAVRLWLDRVFTVRGAGTVVTGTLGGGRIARGASLILARTGARLTVRGIESLGRQRDAADAVSRVALNLRGVDADELGRGDALVSADRWAIGTRVDLWVPDGVDRLPKEVTLHLGAAAHPVRTRRFGTHGVAVTLPVPVPMTYGDRLLLREPGSRVIRAADVVDAAPPPLPRRRGAAAGRARELAELAAGPDPAAELRRRGVVAEAEFATLGVGAVPVEPVLGWLMHPGTAADVRGALGALAQAHERDQPLATGLSIAAAARRVGLPDPRLVGELLPSGWEARSGRLERTGTGSTGLPEDVEASVARIRDRLSTNPFDAPTVPELEEFGLGPTELAAAVRTGALRRLSDGVVLLPDAAEVAVRRLSRLVPPFRTTDAREALGCSRRVALAVLAWLDAERLTRRLPDDRRELAAGVDGGGDHIGGPGGPGELRGPGGLGEPREAGEAVEVRKPGEVG